MGFLFKTSLIHIKKNLPIVSILGFFVGAGVTVLSTSNHLLDGLDRGFQEIHRDSNPHDLVLVGRSFKKNQELNIKPTYNIELSNLKITQDYGYRWAFGSNYEKDFIKKNQIGELKSAVPEVDTGGRDKRSAQEVYRPEGEMVTIDKSIIVIPRNIGLAFRNGTLLCISKKSFINVVAKKLEFQDRNKASFVQSDHPWNGAAIFRPEHVSDKNIVASCSGDSTEHVYSTAYSSYLWGVYKVFNQHIAREKDTLNPDEKINAVPTTEDTDDQKLKPEEIYAIHERRSFNPKRIYRRKIVSGKEIYGFRPLFEEDFLIKFDVAFENILGGKDISGEFRQLASQMRNSRVFYRLDETTRQNILFYLSSQIFEKLQVTYYLASLEDYLDHVTAWVPMVPGMTFTETIIFLSKLFLWNLLDEIKKNEEKPIDLEEFTKWNEDLRDKFSKIIEGWGTSVEDITKWNPYKGLKPAKYVKAPTKSEDYIFSTLRASKKLSEFKNETDHYRAFVSKSESGGGENVDNYCGGLEGSNKDKGCKNAKFDPEKTLFERWKQILPLWIKNQYYGWERDVKSKDGGKGAPSADGEKIFLPSFAKNSTINWTQKKDTSVKPFDPSTSGSQTFNYYRAYPLPFEELYKRIRSWFITSLKSYLTFLRVRALKDINKFISEHNIFTLSFLLYNFEYNPNASIRDKHKKYFKFLPQPTLAKNPPSKKYREFEAVPLDLSLSINYHKSIVVANTGSVSAKLDDNSKLGHSFKVITQESRDGSHINVPKILSGNPLFTAKHNFEDVIKRSSIWASDKSYGFERTSYEYRDIFRILSRLKYTNPEYPKLFKTFYKYVTHNDSDAWNSGAFFSIRELESLLNYLKQLTNNAKDIKKRGSRLFFEFNDYEVINFLSTIPVTSKLNTVSTTGYIDQFTSVFGLISPFYAKKNNIVPISDEQYRKFHELLENEDLTQEEWEKEYSSFILNPENHKSIVNVNGNKLIVVGTALSPDMLLPSQSWLNLVPNKEKEALVFVDEFGYRNIYEKSLSTWNEFYISLTQPKLIKDLGLDDDYNSQLRDYIDEFLVGDSKGKGGYKNDFELRKISEPNIKSLVFLRSNYVENFMGSVNLFSYTLLLLMGAVILFTVWILIKKYITSSLNTFGVFIANGIPKFSIIINSFSFILIPSLFGIVVGYFCSLGLQPIVFSLISDIWYLSPVFSGFHINNLFYYIFLVVSILGTISFSSSFWMLRSGVGDLMKVNMRFKHSKFTKYVYDKLHNLSSIWKFRASVILNTLSRGLVLSSSTVFLFVFSSFLFNNLGQFKKVSNLEISTRDYGFDISLNSPVDQTGQYLLTSYTNLGDTFLNKIPDKKKVFIKNGKNDSNGNPQWDIHEVSYGPNNPQLIATGIYSSVHPQDVKEFLDSCEGDSFEKIYEKLGVLNHNNPSYLFVENPYNTYLLRSTATKKNNGKNSTGCPDKFTDQYDLKTYQLPKPSHKTLKLFHSSDDGDSKNKHFTPDLDDDNVSEILDISAYVPVVNEKWKNKNGQNDAKQPIKFGSELLFKPLIDYYTKRESKIGKHTKKVKDNELTSWEFIDNGSKAGSGEEIDGDFRKIGEKYHPTLSRLFKDHSNYWLFSYTDLESIQKDNSFFRHKVIIPFLFNHNWTFTLFGKVITINPWNEFNAFFAKYSPEIITAMETNYTAFVEAIIKSRYGAFFVNRFMTKHDNTDGDTEHVQGKDYSGKQSWKVNKKIIKKELEKEIDEGIYWFDPKKIIFLYDQIQASEAIGSESSQKSGTPSYGDAKQSKRFVIFRPDFLYLFYTLMKDNDFLKPKVAPIKIVFHQNVYVPDYSKQFTHEWEIDGVPETDANKQLGLTANYTSSLSQEQIKKSPNGDQTYTYLDVSLDDNKVRGRIFGLKQDPRGTYIKLVKGDELINEKLYAEKDSQGRYPAIVNHFTARRLGLSVGSTFEAVVSNTMDRFTKLLKENYFDTKVKFKVVDIYDSYYNTAIFISQSNANEILGLNKDYGYNAILTRKFTGGTQDLPMQLTNVLSGFSPSGFYSKVNIHRSSDEFQGYLGNKGVSGSFQGFSDSKFIQPSNALSFRLLNQISNVYSNNDDLAGLIERVFGSHFALTPNIVGIENASLFNDFVFNTVSDLILSVINLFITILAPLLICALLIITTLIIEDLKNLLAVLSLLGFSNFENSVTVLLYLGLVLLVSMIVAIPLSAILLSVYVEGIFNTISIYLPIYLRFDYVLCSTVLLICMFGFSYFTAIRKIKNIYLPVAMKNINE